MEAINFIGPLEQCSVDFKNKAMQCFVQQQDYFTCQKIPIIVWVALVGLCVLFILDLIAIYKLKKLRREQKSG